MTRFVDRTYYENFSQIEESARSIWEKQGVDRAPLVTDPRPKRYVVGMFPYPSGNAHMGHVRVYALSDCLCRLSKFKGFAVLHPVGWDAFGLPAENAAIKHGVHPAAWVAGNIDRMQHEQLNRIGFSFDWSGQINSSSPEYYRWSQWLFLQLYKNGYVERQKASVNFCPNCQTVLANEQVINGTCWRCSSVVERRELEQWFIRITRLAEDLWRGIDSLQGWSIEATSIQRNWIGRSEGVEINFPLVGSSQNIKIFTTRPDTIFGVTSVTLAPEYPNVADLAGPEQRKEVSDYVAASRQRSDLDRMSDESRTGVFLGRYCENPLTANVVPIYISDYVIGSYGTGAIMNVPAHDSRDYDFARTRNLPIKVVIIPPGTTPGAQLQAAYTGAGVMYDSGQFSGMPSQEAIPAIAEFVEQKGLGKRTVNFKLRDWLVSRQRYWGAPIPMINCPDCGWQPVPDDQLPVLLPDKVDIALSGRSPLAGVPSFVNTSCPKCGGTATHEVDTMDTFMCSAWYVWRFTSPHDTENAWTKQAAYRWMPVDYYVGGLEHAAQHLIYFRFMSHFLYQIGLTPTREPVDYFIDNGMVRFGGAKMSKSRGNVVVPTTAVESYGADALRLTILADTPVQRDIDWTEQGLAGKQRFLAGIWDLYRKMVPHLPKGVARCPDIEEQWERSLVALLYRTALKIEEELEQQRGFHVAIAHLHSFVVSITRLLSDTDSDRRYAVAAFVLQGFLKVLGIFAPHISEVLWREVFGIEESIFFQSWIEVKEELLQENQVEVVFQINGRLRGSAMLPRNSSQEQALATALSDPGLKRYIDGQQIRKTIFVADRLLNIVVG